MMDHMDEAHKPNDRHRKQRVHPDRGECGESAYYYDDSTNYEIYHEESDEPAEGDEDDNGS
jgi:hypothetical protein